MVEELECLFVCYEVDVEFRSVSAFLGAMGLGVRDRG